MAVRNVLAALDFGESSTQALRAAVDWAITCGAALHAVHVVDTGELLALSSRLPRATPEQLRFEAERSARHALADALASAQAPTDTHAIVLVEARAADGVLRYAATAGIDLIAIGPRGRADIAEIFLGSTAQQIVSRALCPVLTVRPPHPHVTDTSHAAP